MSQPILISPLKITQWVEAALEAEGLDPDTRKRIMNRFWWGHPDGPVTRDVVACPHCGQDAVRIYAPRMAADGTCRTWTRYEPCMCVTEPTISLPVRTSTGVDAGAVVVAAPPHPSERFDPSRRSVRYSVRHTVEITGLDGSR